MHYLCIFLQNPYRNFCKIVPEIRFIAKFFQVSCKKRFAWQDFVTNVLTSKNLTKPALCCKNFGRNRILDETSKILARNAFFLN